mmetsp:Transcript_2775/g.6741  ORF Transcript_2775/g.6741 Transcript_2775/m.6741 type:complete len:206 (+) Transcript_2775:417-1034(+)
MSGQYSRTVALKESNGTSPALVGSLRASTDRTSRHSPPMAVCSLKRRYKANNAVFAGLSRDVTEPRLPTVGGSLSGGRARRWERRSPSWEPLLMLDEADAEVDRKERSSSRYLIPVPDASLQRSIMAFTSSSASWSWATMSNIARTSSTERTPVWSLSAVLKLVFNTAQCWFTLCRTRRSSKCDGFVASPQPFPPPPPSAPLTRP